MSGRFSQRGKMIYNVNIFFSSKIFVDNLKKEEHIDSGKLMIGKKNRPGACTIKLFTAVKMDFWNKLRLYF
jgi:hypothetical protein